jgi:hypothetical protein
MTRKVKTWLYAGFTILIVASLIAGFSWIFRPKPVTIEKDLPLAVEATSIVKRMYVLEGNITCVPGTTVDVLADVLIDSPDYQLTSYDKSMIEKVYGKQALTHAGLLTAKHAYYLARDLPVPTPTKPATGRIPRPTATPVYICSPDRESIVEEYFRYVSTEQWQDGHVTVTYDFTSGRYEAILRRFDGKWKITSVKMIKFYGNG